MHRLFFTYLYMLLSFSVMSSPELDYGGRWSKTLNFKYTLNTKNSHSSEMTTGKNGNTYIRTKKGGYSNSKFDVETLHLDLAKRADDALVSLNLKDNSHNVVTAGMTLIYKFGKIIKLNILMLVKVSLSMHL